MTTSPAPSSRPSFGSWLAALLPAAVALLVVTGMLVAGAAVVSRGVAVVSGLLTGG